MGGRPSVGDVGRYRRSVGEVMQSDLCGAVTRSGYVCLATGALPVLFGRAVILRCTVHRDVGPELPAEAAPGLPALPLPATLSEVFSPAVGSREWMSVLMETIFDECRALRSAGQVEYARRQDNAFGNFDRVAERQPKVGPEDVLMVYFDKHVDGILAHLDGHTSQREPVEGRINDAIVYLCLLRGLIERRRAREAQA